MVAEGDGSRRRTDAGAGPRIGLERAPQKRTEQWRRLRIATRKGKMNATTSTATVVPDDAGATWLERIGCLLSHTAQNRVIGVDGGETPLPDVLGLELRILKKLARIDPSFRIDRHLAQTRAAVIANPAGFPGGRWRDKVAIPLPLIVVLKITGPGSFRA